MSEEKPQLISPMGTALKFGLAMGILLTIYFYFTTQKAISDKENSAQTNILFIIMILVPIVLAIMEHRRKFVSKIMRFSEALGAGVITSFIGGIVFSIFIASYSYMNPDVMAQLAAQANQTKATEGLITSDVGKSIGSGFFYFVATFFLGFLLSLISSLFLFKRKA